VCGLSGCFGWLCRRSRRPFVVSCCPKKGGWRLKQKKKTPKKVGVYPPRFLLWGNTPFPWALPFSRKTSSHPVLRETSFRGARKTLYHPFFESRTKRKLYTNPPVLFPNLLPREKPLLARRRGPPNLQMSFPPKAWFPQG